jgi:hypothetical protein
MLRCTYIACLAVCILTLYHPHFELNAVTVVTHTCVEYWKCCIAVLVCMCVCMYVCTYVCVKLVIYLSLLLQFLYTVTLLHLRVTELNTFLHHNLHSIQFVPHRRVYLNS